ncbi:MAG: MFS transporter, partial [Myxococcota bacterium]
GAFSVASVLGVPAGLELARVADWRMPFFAVAGLGLLITIGAVALLPSMRGHLARTEAHPRMLELLARPLVRWSYVLTTTVFMSGFLVVPNFSAYLQGNLHYPRERLGILYLTGGLFSFWGMRLIGRLVDTFGAVRVGTFATLAVSVVTAAWFLVWHPAMPILFLFVCYMLTTSGRNVAYNTLVSKVPAPHERARFLSVQSAVQHLAAALGAVLSAEILTQHPDGSLGGVERMAWLSIALAVVAPFVMAAVGSRLPATRAAA